MYDQPITKSVAASVYVAAVGEPALGPVAFMHRPSAQSDPFAPIGHHWQDASHTSFGVVTAGMYTRVAKLEGSVFNARDPDEYRFNLDYKGASLDSYSGRVDSSDAQHRGLGVVGLSRGSRSARARLEDAPLGVLGARAARCSIRRRLVDGPRDRWQRAPSHWARPRRGAWRPHCFATPSVVRPLAGDESRARQAQHDLRTRRNSAEVGRRVGLSRRRPHRVVRRTVAPRAGTCDIWAM